jgi:hypothetical protein
MPYTRLLKLDADTKNELISYLNTEILNHKQERSQYDQQLVDWNQDYWAEPVTKEKTFPFKGACSIIIPLTAIAVEAVHANVMGTLFGLPDFLNVTARAPAYADSVRSFENYANYELQDRIKIRKRIEPAILEIEKFGTGVAKAKYEKIIKYGMKEVAGVETEFPVVIRDGAMIDCVACSRFMMPFNAQSAQDAPWAGELHLMTPSDIEIQEQSGLFDKGTYDNIKQFYSTNLLVDPVTIQQEDNEKRSPVVPNMRINFYEMWCDYDIDGSEIKKAIQVYYHYESQTLMGVRYNTFSNLRRPYRHGVYIPVEHRWAGIGICKQNDQFQLEITIQHRQRIDNATIANIRMFKVAKMSGYGPKEPIFPGKMWFLDDMNDIEAFQIGEIYPSAYNNEQQSLLYSQQRTGINELTLGMAQSGTPGTATSDLARVQESKRKSDFVIDNMKEFITEVCYDVFDVIQTYGPQNVSYLQANDPSGQLVQVLSLPNEAIRDAIIFKLNISGQSTNQILDQQKAQQLAQVTQQYWTGMMELAQATQNPMIMMAITQKAMSSATEVFEELLTTMNIKNIERIAFDQQILTQLLNPGQQQPQGQQLLSSGAQPAGGSPVNTQLPIAGGNQTASVSQQAG